MIFQINIFCQALSNNDDSEKDEKTVDYFALKLGMLQEINDKCGEVDPESHELIDCIEKVEKGYSEEEKRILTLGDEQLLYYASTFKVDKSISRFNEKVRELIKSSKIKGKIEQVKVKYVPEEYNSLSYAFFLFDARMNLMVCSDEYQKILAKNEEIRPRDVAQSFFDILKSDSCEKKGEDFKTKISDKFPGYIGLFSCDQFSSEDVQHLLRSLLDRKSYVLDIYKRTSLSERKKDAENIANFRKIIGDKFVVLFNYFIKELNNFESVIKNDFPDYSKRYYQSIFYEQTVYWLAEIMKNHRIDEKNEHREKLVFDTDVNYE